MKFQTPYDLEELVPEKNEGISVTERAGYMSSKEQIESLIYAGQVLDEYKREEYDFAPGQEDDDDFEDPTRRPNFDLADYSAYAREVNARLAKAAREAKLEKASEGDGAATGDNALVDKPESRESASEGSN